MIPPRPTNRVYLVLCLNAAVLLMILLMLVSRESRLFGTPPAFAQEPPANAATTVGHGMSVMPAQLSPQVWGCYVMDNDNQTLSVYSYSPGEHQLRLAAVRDVQYDRRLGDFNTSPSPSEIKEMLDRAKEPIRAVIPTPVSPETTRP